MHQRTMHKPMLLAAHQPRPKPFRPSRTPGHRQSTPRTPRLPGPTSEQSCHQACKLHPLAQVSPAALHAATRKNTTQEQPTPYLGQDHRPPQDHSPSAEPPINPPLGNTQMPVPDRIVTTRVVTTLGDGADQRSPERAEAVSRLT